jgi:hypothetical protein
VTGEPLLSLSFCKKNKAFSLDKKTANGAVFLLYRGNTKAIPLVKPKAIPLVKPKAIVLAPS